MARLPKSALQSGPKSLYSSFPITYVDVWTFNIRRHLFSNKITSRSGSHASIISARWSLPARDILVCSSVVTGSRFLCIRETLRRRFERLGRLLRYFFKSPSGKCWKYKENTAGNFKASKQNNKASSENTQNQLKYQENLCKIMKNHQKTVKFDKNEQEIKQPEKTSVITSIIRAISSRKNKQNHENLEKSLKY